MHAAFLEPRQAARSACCCLGDSSHEGVNPARAHIMGKVLRAMSPPTSGIGGDRTQHVIWRNRTRRLDGLHRKSSCSCSATNNSADNTAEKSPPADKKSVGMIRARFRDENSAAFADFPPRRAQGCERRGSPTHSIASGDQAHGRHQRRQAELAKLDDGLMCASSTLGRLIGQDGKIP